MIKLRHERMLILILRCILPPLQKGITSRKKITAPHNLNTLKRNSSHWEYLNPIRNLQLRGKYQPPPPPPSQKKKPDQAIPL